MKRSIFLLIVVSACAVPIFLAKHYKKRHLDRLHTSIDTAPSVIHHSPQSENVPVEEGSASEVQSAPSAGPVVIRGKEQIAAGIAKSQGESEEENIELKKKEVIKLVDRALKFIDNHPFDVSCSAFTHGREFIEGELYLFVYDMNGVCAAHGQSPELIWQNKLNLRDPYGTYIIRESIAIAQAGGGWITYQWRNATKVSYVRPFTKDGVRYLIGSGYYTHSKPDAVIKLVKGAVIYFRDLVASDPKKIDEAFSLLSYPIGRFLQGDLFLYAMNFDGTMMANGEQPGLIGTNALNTKDERGNAYNQEIITKLKEIGDVNDGIWIEFRAKNTTKKIYAQKEALIKNFPSKLNQHW